MILFRYLFGNSTYRLFVVLPLLIAAGCQSVARNNHLEFALIGDSPYKAHNFPKYERMIKSINNHGDLAWVVHIGDFKDGGTSCADAAYFRVHQMNQKFEMPFVLTPGDNDWFDCKRKVAGGFDRVERLSRVREIFYSEPLDLPVTRQSESGEYQDYVENAYWVENGVLFATVHTVGITGLEGGVDLHNAVLEAGVAWLDIVFGKAREIDAKGVFIATQADIYPFSGDINWLKLLCEKCSRVRPMYESLHESLIKHTRAFTSPVVLAVGDTHLFRVDKPLYDGDHLVSHFTRVESFGENEVHWVRVVVDPKSPQVFSFHQELIPENIGTGNDTEEKSKP